MMLLIIVYHYGIKKRDMENAKQHILVVDDEQDICDILQFNLKTNGYDVDTVNSGEEALQTIKGAANPYDLVLLDVMMGGISGFETAQALKAKQETASLPIIFLTAKDSANDTITGLNIGADDYISKPFSLQEVLLRIKAVLRRTSQQAPARKANRLVYETMVLDLDRKTVSIDGDDVPFTKTEYELLRLLLEEKGRVLSRQELIERAWPSDVLVSDRTVDVNITRMRKKIGVYSANIVTRLGFGYLFEA